MKAIVQMSQPTTATMEFFGKYLKLSGLQTLGLYALLTGVHQYHLSAVQALMQELLAKMKLDETHLEFFSSIAVWIAGVEKDFVRKAQVDLGLCFKELTLVAKQICDPCDLPREYLTQNFGLSKGDELVVKRRVLKWSESPGACREWCKALALKITEVSPISQWKRLMARGQLMLADQFPHLYMKKLLDQKLAVDDRAYSFFRSILNVAFINRVQGSKRRSVLNNLSKFLDVEENIVSSWVLMVSAPDSKDKLMYLKDWAAAWNLSKSQGIQRLVCEFCHQEKLFSSAVNGLDSLAEKLGVPSSMVVSMANGISDGISKFPHIRDALLEKTISELGVSEGGLISALIAFANRRDEEVEPLGTALGLQPNTLTTILNFFGGNSSVEIIETFGQLLKKFNLPVRGISNSKALLALGLKTNERFRGPDERRVSCSDMLAEALTLPSLVIQGMIAAAHKDFEGMRHIIADMARARTSDFVIEESYARGLVSMSLGTVQNIEDVCAAVRLDADIAEVLVQLSSPSPLTYSLLKTSSNFQKFSLKLGLDDSKLAALIAVIKSDSLEDVSEHLDETQSIPRQFFSGLLTLFMYKTGSNSWSRQYNSDTKMRKMRETLPWLCKKIEFSSYELALLVCMLAQGDTAVLGSLQSRLGWSGIERDYYASLACLINSVPFTEETNHTESFTWMTYKHLPTIASNLAALFKVNVPALSLLIKLGRHDRESLKEVKETLGLKTVKEVIKFVDELVLEEEVNVEEDEEDFKLTFEQEDDPGTPNSAYLSQFSSDSGEFLIDSKPSKAELTLEGSKDYLRSLLTFLNSNNTSEERPFDDRLVKFILTTASGLSTHLNLLEEILEDQKCKINYVTARDVMLISASDYDALSAIELSVSQPEAKRSILLRYNEEHTSVPLKFLLMLATGNEECWDLEYEQNHGMGSKIYYDTRVLKAFTALFAKDPSKITRNSDSLAAFYELDADILEILLLLSIGDIQELAMGISPLTRRLDLDHELLMGFIGNCLHTDEALEKGLQTLCERISSPSLDVKLAKAIYKASKGELDSWVTLGYHFAGLKFMSAKKQSKELGLLTLLSRYVEGKIKPVADTTNETLTLLLKRLELDKLTCFSGSSSFMPGKNQLPLFLFNATVGIANDSISMIPHVLHLLDEDPEKSSLICNLVSVFKETGNKLVHFTNLIETELDKHNVALPAGVFQATIGTVNRLPTLVLKGVTKAADHQKQTGTHWAQRFDKKLAKLFMELVQHKLDTDSLEGSQQLTNFLEALTGVNHMTLDSPGARVLLSFLSRNRTDLISSIGNQFNINQDLLKELYTLSVNSNPLKLTSFPEFTRGIQPLFKGIPGEVLESLIKLLSGKVVNLDYGREGMGTDLHRATDFILRNFKKESRIVSEVKPTRGSLEIDVCDAFFLAITDPYKYTEVLFNNMPNLAHILAPGIRPKAVHLISGLVALYQSEFNTSLRKESISLLSKAFGVESYKVRGLIALPKRDWEGLSDMANTFCEFDPVRIQQLVQLIRRLKLFIDAEEDTNALSSDLKQLQKQLENDSEIYQLFYMLDADGSGELSFDEFKELMKYFNFQFTQHRLIEIFSNFDDDGSSTMNVQEFEGAVDYIKGMISSGVMTQLSVSNTDLFAGFIASVFILLFVFAFILLGVIGFISVSQFGTSINSLMPISSGGVLFRLRAPGTMDGKIDEISTKLMKVLAVVTINNI